VVETLGFDVISLSLQKYGNEIKKTAIKVIDSGFFIL